MKFLINVILLISTTAFAQLENIPLITVYGESTIKVKPDYVVLGLRVNKQLNLNANGTAKEFKIFNPNDTKINLFDFSDKNISESLIQIDSAVYIKEVFITIYNLDKLENYLLEIHNQGYNNLFYFDYRLSDLENHMNEAKMKAIESAKKKAALLAHQLGQSIGKAHLIEEVPVENFNWYNINKANDLENLSYNLGSQNYVLHPSFITIRSKIKVSFDLIK